MAETIIPDYQHVLQQVRKGIAVVAEAGQVVRRFDTLLPFLEAEGAEDLALTTGYSRDAVPGTLQLPSFGRAMLGLLEQRAGGTSGLPIEAVNRFIEAGSARQRSLRTRPVAQLWVSRATAFAPQTSLDRGISPELHNEQIQSILHRLTADPTGNKYQLRIIHEDEAQQTIGDVGAFALMQTGDLHWRAFHESYKQIEEAPPEFLLDTWRTLWGAAMSMHDSIDFLHGQMI